MQGLAMEALASGHEASIPFYFQIVQTPFAGSGRSAIQGMCREGLFLINSYGEHANVKDAGWRWSLAATILVGLEAALDDLQVGPRWGPDDWTERFVVNTWGFLSQCLHKAMDPALAQEIARIWILYCGHLNDSVGMVLPLLDFWMVLAREMPALAGRVEVVAAGGGFLLSPQFSIWNGQWGNLVLGKMMDVHAVLAQADSNQLGSSVFQFLRSIGWTADRPTQLEQVVGWYRDAVGNAALRDKIKTDMWRDAILARDAFWWGR
jgi:hypothetical protein